MGELRWLPGSRRAQRTLGRSSRRPRRVGRLVVFNASGPDWTFKEEDGEPKTVCAVAGVSSRLQGRMTGSEQDGF